MAEHVQRTRRIACAVAARPRGERKGDRSVNTVVDGPRGMPRVACTRGRPTSQSVKVLPGGATGLSLANPLVALTYDGRTQRIDLACSGLVPPCANFTKHLWKTVEKPEGKLPSAR